MQRLVDEIGALQLELQATKADWLTCVRALIRRKQGRRLPNGRVEAAQALVGAAEARRDVALSWAHRTEIRLSELQSICQPGQSRSGMFERHRHEADAHGVALHGGASWRSSFPIRFVSRGLQANRPATVSVLPARCLEYSGHTPDLAGSKAGVLFEPAGNECNCVVDARLHGACSLYEAGARVCGSLPRDKASCGDWVSMRVVIDLQSAQSASNGGVIEQHSMAFAQSLVRHADGHEVLAAA